MNIEIPEDISNFIKDNHKFNYEHEITLQGYVNALIERGVMEELRDEGYTEDSIQKFMMDLMMNKKANWNLLASSCLVPDKSLIGSFGEI